MSDTDSLYHDGRATDEYWQKNPFGEEEELEEEESEMVQEIRRIGELNRIKQEGV